jgi:hypothetical protein
VLRRSTAASPRTYRPGRTSPPRGQSTLTVTLVRSGSDELCVELFCSLLLRQPRPRVLQLVRGCRINQRRCPNTTTGIPSLVASRLLRDGCSRSRGIKLPHSPSYLPRPPAGPSSLCRRCQLSLENALRPRLCDSVPCRLAGRPPVRSENLSGPDRRRRGLVR